MQLNSAYLREDGSLTFYCPNPVSVCVTWFKDSLALHTVHEYNSWSLQRVLTCIASGYYDRMFKR